MMDGTRWSQRTRKTRPGPWIAPAVLAGLLSLGGFGEARAQTVPTSAAPPAVEPVPFGPGERMEYQVKLSPFGEVGEGSMEVVGVQTVRDRPSYLLRLDLEASVLFASVDDRMQSWLDVSTLASHRFEQDQDEVAYKRHRILDFFPERGEWVHTNSEDGNSGPLASDRPLDDISFLYYARTLPLEVGETYTLDRYYKDDGNPVVLQVVRRDTITVPAGEFETIVVRPIIQTDGLFGEGGRAEVHFSDDERRMLVRLESNVPVLGSLSLHLRSFRNGRKYLPVTSLPTGGTGS